MRQRLPNWVLPPGNLPVGDGQRRGIVATTTALAVGLGVAGAAAAGASAYGAHRAGKAQESALNKQASLGKQQLWFEQDKYKDEQARRAWFDSVFRPGYKSAVDEAMRPTDEQPGYLAAIGQYERGMGDVSGSMRRKMGGRYSTGSGAEQATARRVALEAPRGRAGIRSEYDQRRLQNLMATLGIGGGVASQPIHSNTSGAYAALMNMYGQNAANFGNMAQQGWGAAGNALFGTARGLAGMYGAGMFGGGGGGTYIDELAGGL